MILEIVLGAFAYVIPTMPYAYFWHMVWFKDKYEQWQYFGDDASIPLGFTSMVIQGIVLSYAYTLLPIEHSAIANGLFFSAVMGIFFWSTHVISAMAKHGATRTREYLVMETVYLIGQFGLFGLLIGVVHALV